MGAVESRRDQGPPKGENPAARLAFPSGKLDQSWWVNKVGPYGMAGAQLYWGRTAALILRILYDLFPEVDWGFVFVDDFCWLFEASTAEHMATAILSTVLALGVPLSWKKTLAEINTWLAFVIHPNTLQVQMAAPRHVLVLEILDQLVQDQAFSAKAIERARGRIQWATAVCPLTRSLLQPFPGLEISSDLFGEPHAVFESRLLRDGGGKLSPV